MERPRISGSTPPVPGQRKKKRDQVAAKLPGKSTRSTPIYLWMSLTPQIGITHIALSLIIRGPGDYPLEL